MLTSAKSARRATSFSLSPLVRQGWGAGTATHGAGGTAPGGFYFLGPPWLRPRVPQVPPFFFICPAQANFCGLKERPWHERHCPPLPLVRFISH
jgi:hypothetical protein